MMDGGEVELEADDFDFDFGVAEDACRGGDPPEPVTSFAI